MGVRQMVGKDVHRHNIKTSSRFTCRTIIYRRPTIRPHRRRRRTRFTHVKTPYKYNIKAIIDMKGRVPFSIVLTQLLLLMQLQRPLCQIAKIIHHLVVCINKLTSSIYRYTIKLIYLFSIYLSLILLLDRLIAQAHRSKKSIRAISELKRATKLRPGCRS